MKHLLVRLSICFVTFGVGLYSYLDQQNGLTQIKMQLPRKQKEIQQLREEMRRLSYQLDQYENPNRLIELAHLPEFSHLKHPVLKEILTVPEALALNE
jgi:uncharacterized protein HemX